MAAVQNAVSDLTWQSWFTIALVFGGLVCMVNDSPPDVVLLAINLTLRVFNIITEEQAWSGFRSEGLLAIGVLFGPSPPSLFPAPSVSEEQSQPSQYFTGQKA